MREIDGPRNRCGRMLPALRLCDLDSRKSPGLQDILECRSLCRAVGEERAGDQTRRAGSMLRTRFIRLKASCDLNLRLLIQNCFDLLHFNSALRRQHTEQAHLARNQAIRGISSPIARVKREVKQKIVTFRLPLSGYFSPFTSHGLRRADPVPLWIDAARAVGR